MKHSFSILIDGAFFFRMLKKHIKRVPTIDDVEEAISKIVEHSNFKEFDLLRTYYYDANPSTGILKNPISGQKINLAETNVYRRNRSFLDKLELCADVALRLGETSSNGWKLNPTALENENLSNRALLADDLVMDIEQKGVDLRIGLDIARLSLKRLVHTIVVITGDSDLVPAFKFARREGVRVALCHMGHGVKRELRAHTDQIIEIKFK